MNQDDLVAFSRARLAHANQKRLLQEKYQARMVFAHSGGMFRAGPELLTLLAMYAGQSIVIEDLYHSPVRVDVDQLRTQASCIWQEQMNAWLVELESTAQQR